MRNLLLALLLVFSLSQLSSQIGIRGGLNYSNVSVDGGGPNIGEDAKPGFHLGFQGAINFGGLNIRPALLYHVKGGKVVDNGASDNTNLQYLEVPINLGFKIGGDRFAIIGEAGPYFGYLLNTSSGFFNDLDDRLDKSDWGINFGLVVEFSDLGVGANYSNSLSSIANEDRLGQAFKTTNGNFSVFIYMNI